MEVRDGLGLLVGLGVGLLARHIVGEPTVEHREAVREVMEAGARRVCGADVGVDRGGHTHDALGGGDLPNLGTCHRSTFENDMAPRLPALMRTEGGDVVGMVKTGWRRVDANEPLQSSREKKA